MGKQKVDWEKEKESIIDRYLKGETTNKIAETYNVYGTTIGYKLKEWNIPIRKNRYNSKYDFDYHFFDNIDSEEKAYWLGFLLADGHVNKNGISLVLQKRDIDMIYLFKNSLKSEHPVFFDSHGNPGITIKSVYISKKLYEMGFNNRKSYYIDFKKVLSFVPKNLEHHFVRGMFDGDGCIKMYSYPYETYYHFAYTGLEYICEYVKEILGIDRKLINESNNTYSVITRDPQKIISIFSYLYDEANFYLQRKYLEFQKINFNLKNK